MDPKHHATAVDITRRWLSSSAKWNFGRYSNDVDSDFYNLLGLQFPLPSDLEEDTIRCVKERVKVEKKRVWRDTLVDMTHSDKPDVALQAGKLLAQLPAVNPPNVNNFVISGNVNSKVTFDNLNVRNDVGEGSASKKRKTRHETPPLPLPPPLYPSGTLEDDPRLGAKGKQVARAQHFLPATVDGDGSDAESDDNTTPQASASRQPSSSCSIDEATFFAAFDAMASQCDGCCRHNNDPDHQGCSGCCSHPPTQVLSSSASPLREATPRAQQPAGPAAADVPEISSPSPGPAPHCSCAAVLEQLKHDMREQKRQIEDQGKILQSVRNYLLLQRKADKTLTELLLNLQDFEGGNLD